MQVEKIDTFSGHRGAVYTLEKGEEKEIFFSGGADGMLVQWNLGKPDVGKGIAQMGGAIFDLKYVSQTKEMWISVHQKGIYVINLNSFSTVFFFPQTDHSTYAMELVGECIWVSNSIGEVLVFDIFDKKILTKIQVGHKSIRKIIQWNNKFIFFGSSDGHIRILNNQFQLIFDEKCHEKTCFSLAIDKNGKFLVSIGKDAQVKKWKIESGQLTLLEELVGHIYGIHDVTLNLNSSLFATASMDKTVKIWDLNEFKLVKVIDSMRHGGHKNAVNKLYWSDYQDFLVSASDDKNISVWNLNY